MASILSVEAVLPLVMSMLADPNPSSPANIDAAVMFRAIQLRTRNDAKCSSYFGLRRERERERERETVLFKDV